MKIGTKVKVTQRGLHYDLYPLMFERMGFSENSQRSFPVYPKHAEFTIFAKSMHHIHDDVQLYGIEYENGSQFLFESDGLMEVSEVATETQIGGNHYQMKIQPITFILENKLNFAQGNVIKYVCRYDKKNGIEDLEKAKHYIDLLIEHEKYNLNSITK